MMLAFIDNFANCCIGMLSGINNVKYIMDSPHFKDKTINDLTTFMENINRYKYNQGDIEAEVIQVEFFLREWVIEGYTNLSYSTYYVDLRKIWSSLKLSKEGEKKAKEQHAHISTILKNAQYSDENKLKEIQKYTTAENKELVKKVNDNTRLNKVSLISVDEKLKFITEKIDKLEEIINLDFFTPAGKINYNNYLKITRRQGTQGGKKRGSIAKRGGGLRSSIRKFFKKNNENKDTPFKKDKENKDTPIKKNKENRVIPVNEDVSQDYMTVLNIYKDGHIKKLRKIYELIASIFNYTEYHRNIAREDALKQYVSYQEYQQLKTEYNYLLEPVKGFNENN